MAGYSTEVPQLPAASPSSVATLTAALLQCGGTGRVSVNIERGLLTVQVSGENQNIQLSDEEIRWAQTAAKVPSSSQAPANVNASSWLKSRPDLSFDDIYDTVRTLGTGATAEVRLVRHRITGNEYAASDRS